MHRTTVFSLVIMTALLAGGGCVNRGGPEGPDPQAQDEILAARERAAEMERQRLAELEATRREATRAEQEARRREAGEILSAPVHFDYDSHAIPQDAMASLRRKAEILRDNPSVTIRIEGHADERGSLEYNLALGQRRSTSVRDFLSNLGVDRARLATLSYGKERLIDPGTTEAAHRRNRRAEFILLQGSF